MNRVEVQQTEFQFPPNIQPEGIIIRVSFYRKEKMKTIIFIIMNIILMGIPYLFSRWYTRVWGTLCVSRCDNEMADYTVVVAQDHTETITKTNRIFLTINGVEKFYMILEFRFYRYYYDNNMFVTLDFDITNLSQTQIIQQYSGGINSEELKNTQMDRYGINSNDIPDKSTYKLLIEEVLSPFYIFQIFSVLLWFIEAYSHYATIILIISVFSICELLYQQNKNYKKLQQMAHNECLVDVSRSGNVISISSRDLVPGDLIIVKDGMIIPCDLILLNGQCVMNEAMLTGESIPMIKSPMTMSDMIYNPQEEGKQFTIFAGTQCIQSKALNNHPIGIVSQTGFNTQKGQLIRAIMYTQQSSFKFYQDSLKFIFVMAGLAVVGFLVTLKPSLEQIEILGIDAVPRLFMNVLDLVTITVPPSLPACLQIGMSIGLYRLKRGGIFCICPHKINIAGKVTLMCFDKTGTITEEGLDFYGIRIVGIEEKNQQLTLGDLSIDSLSNQSKVLVYGQNLPVPMSAGILVHQVMASCHGLTMLNEDIIGDPLDKKLFEQTNCIIRNSSQQQQLIIQQNQQPQCDDDEKLYIANATTVLKKFDFSSKQQRMSVIVVVNGSQRILSKGSPEKIRDLCKPQSIPYSFVQVLEFYAQNGFRVLCCATKLCNYSEQQLEQLQRDEVECDLTFLGFLILENKLKPATIAVIEHLQRANIRSLMVTGDNVLTAVSVARSCNMINEEQRVFIGELEQGKRGKKIIWRDFDGRTMKIGPTSFDMKQVKESLPNDEKLDHQFREEGYRIFISKSQCSLSSQIKEASLRNIEEASDNLNDYELAIQEEAPEWQNATDDFVLAISGPAFTFLLSTEQDILPLLQRCQVYARMRPDEKANLISVLQNKLNLLIGFCGDGANDCGALKAADLGISLSQAEASIAAPFTSITQDISCVPILLCEGRAALVTSFTCFKYMTMYSIIQFTSTCILYFAFTSFNDDQFLFIDLIVIIPLSMTMGFSKARKTLNKYVPKGSLISAPVLISVLGVGLIQFLFQVQQNNITFSNFYQIFVYKQLTMQSWFVSSKKLNFPSLNEDDYYICFESTTIFIFSNFQYVFTVLAFSTGKPFRKPFYNNQYFTCSIVLILIIELSILFNEEWKQTLGLYYGNEEYQMPRSWIMWIATVASINSIITVLYERQIVPKISKIYSQLYKK